MPEDHTDLRKPIDEVRRDFLENGVEYFKFNRTRPDGFYGKIGEIEKELETLNENLDKSIKSSTALSKSINWLTSAGTIIAAATLAFEVYKHTSHEDKDMTPISKGPISNEPSN